jgi:hypothetical protein
MGADMRRGLRVEKPSDLPAAQPSMSADESARKEIVC